MSVEQAEEHKKVGNLFFAKGNFNDAIQEYSTAIIRSPNNPIYYTNRALAYLKLKNYENVVHDSQRASELDPKSVKAHYFLAQGLTHSGRYDKAYSTLQTAYDLALNEKSTFALDISEFMLLTRKKRWEKKEKKRIETESLLLQRMKNILDEERNRKIFALTESNDSDQVEVINYEHEETVGQLELVFAQADENLKVRVVPDSFLDKISFNIMQDPVITPSGVTYERTQLLLHMQRIGHFDPFTRQPLKESHFVPNIALRETITEFLKDNEWAVDY